MRENANKMNVKKRDCLQISAKKSTYTYGKPIAIAKNIHIEEAVKRKKTYN